MKDLGSFVCTVAEVVTIGGSLKSHCVTLSQWQSCTEAKPFAAGQWGYKNISGSRQEKSVKWLLPEEGSSQRELRAERSFFQEGWKKLQDFHEGDDREQESKEWELHLGEFRYCRGPEGFEEPAGTNGHFLTGGVDRPRKSQGELEQVVLRKACRPGRTSWRSFQERAARSKEESKCRDK